MPKVLILALLSILSFSSAHANTSETRPFNLSANLAGLPLGAYGLRVQYSILPYLTLTMPIDLVVKKASLISDTTLNILRIFGYGMFPDLRISSGLGVMLHYQGWYFEPSISLGYAKILYPYFEQAMFLFSPTFLIGYQMIFDSGFLINIGIGVSGLYYFPEIVGTNAWIPIGVLGLGYAF